MIQLSNLPIQKWTAICAIVLQCAAGSAGFAASAFEQGQEALFQKDYDTAIDCYRRAMKEESSHASAAGGKLFFIFKLLHRYEDAEALLKDLARLNADRDYAVELATLYETAGMPYDAQRVYTEMLSQHPDDSQALLGLGRCAEATGNFSTASDFYNRVLSRGGDFADAARRQLSRINNAAKGVKIDSDNEIGRWPASSMPVKVFIADGTGIKGYSAALREYITEAITSWNAAANGLMRMAVVNDKLQADITVGWVESIPGALGEAMPRFNSKKDIVSVKMFIACGTDAGGRPLPPETPATKLLYEARERMLKEVALHEFGHAIGLNHSSRTDDIMSDGIFGLMSEDVPTARTIQPGDIERVCALYAESGSIATKTTNPAKPGQAAPSPRQPGAGTVQIVTTTTRPHSPSSTSSAMLSETAAAFKNAMFNLTNGNYEAALDDLSSVINRDPKNAKAHYLSAIALVNLRKYEEAAKQYQQVLQLAPSGELSQLAAAGLAKIQH